jgi:hypothetical protein
MKGRVVMGVWRGWVVAVMAAGIAASVAAGALFWLVLTRPVSAAALVGAGF